MYSRSPSLGLCSIVRALTIVFFSLSLISSATKASAQVQNVPLISGGLGFTTSTNGGSTSYVPTIVPVLAAPLGEHFLVESRATLLEDFLPKSGGGYTTTHFIGLAYLQGDYIATRHITLVGGYFLTPFGTYNERLAPIWISNFGDVPLITSIGAMNSGSGTGGMLRGNVYSTSKVSIDYAAYFSARSANEQFRSSRSTGERVEAYFPKQRLEIGVSYGRFLQQTRMNDYGFHVWWQPAKVPLRVLSEYAHDPHAQGYWIETDYRLSQFRGPQSVLGRLEPVFRWQQTFRNVAGGDQLPAADTQRTDFGLDYHLPHEVRINTSYARQFSSTGNKNVWETGIVYRFLFPTWKGK
jgi:hypothetical protein